MSAQQAYDQFWPKQQDDMRCLEPGSFKQQELPLARIKKIMQSDEEVGKVAAPVPVIISRALELFTETLLMRAKKVTAQRGARTLTPSHL